MFLFLYLYRCIRPDTSGLDSEVVNTISNVVAALEDDALQ